MLYVFSCVSERNQKGDMGLHLKITAGLLLLVQTFHLAALQDSTDSPGRTIDKAWLRELAKNTAGGQTTTAEEETEYDQGPDATGMESTNDLSSGIASGSMTVYDGKDGNEASQEKSEASETSDDLTVVMTTEPPTFPNVRTKLPELTTTTATTDSTNSSQTNMTEAEEELNNSTTTPQNTTTNLIAQNSTGFPDFSNRTDLQTTTMAPENNATQETTTKNDGGLTSTTTTATTTAGPVINETTTTSSSTTVFPPVTTETIPETTTTAAPNTPEKANLTDKNAASGSNSERGTAAVSGIRVSGAHFCVHKTALCVFLAA